MSERVLTQRELNRAVLARQLLLRRVPLTIPQALDRIAGIQNQYAPSAYVRLWSCLERFERGDLDRALERRSVIQGTMMRATIHLVSKRDYWPFVVAVREAQKQWWLRIDRTRTARGQERLADELRAVLADGPRHHKDLVAIVGRGWGMAGPWLDLVRVPPSGTWEKRRAHLFATAELWVGPEAVDAEGALDHLVRRYLAAFGPASRADIASWAGMRVGDVAPALDRIRLRRFRDEGGKELLDVPGAPLPDPETPAPVRFVPWFDSVLWAHARRTGILPERHRDRILNIKNSTSVAPFLVDGAVAGSWRYENGRVAVDVFERLSREARRELDDEAERLTAFHA